MAKIKELDDLDITEKETSFIKSVDMSKAKKTRVADLKRMPVKKLK